MAPSFTHTAIVLMALLPSVQVFGQSGCTDPLGKNYMPQIKTANGSCLYDTSKVAPISSTHLGEKIVETSGLVLLGNHAITHNDSGGEPALYAVNKTSGLIDQTFTVSFADNIDWEELAQDSNYIYIGEFGNNMGNRSDLKILRIDKAHIPESDDANVRAENIHFHVPNQPIGFPKRQHDFDFESMLSTGDHLHLFSKNRATDRVKHYRLNNEVGPGIQEALIIETKNIPGFITAADISPDGRVVALLGLQNGITYIHLLYGFVGDLYFSGNFRTIQVEGHAFQMEALAFDPHESGIVYLTNEQSGGNENQLHKIDLRPFVYFWNTLKIDLPVDERPFPVDISKISRGNWLLKPKAPGVIDVRLENGQQIPLRAAKNGYTFKTSSPKTVIVRFAAGNGTPPISRQIVLEP